MQNEKPTPATKFAPGLPATLVRAVERANRKNPRAPIICEVWSEGRDGYWATLNRGWMWDDEVHSVHGPTVFHFGEAIRAIRPCGCVECRPEAKVPAESMPQNYPIAKLYNPRI